MTPLSIAPSLTKPPLPQFGAVREVTPPVSLQLGEDSFEVDGRTFVTTEDDTETLQAAKAGLSAARGGVGNPATEIDKRAVAAFLRALRALADKALG